MPLLSQMPGELNFEVALGDDFVPVVTSVSGTYPNTYTYEANVVTSIGVEVPFAVSGTSLDNSQLTLYLTDLQIRNDIQTGDHDWYLSRTINNITRRWLAGYFHVRKYPP